MSTTHTTIDETQIPELFRKLSDDPERMVVVREGKELAAVVSLEDLAVLEELDDLLDEAALEASRKEAREQGTISLAEVKARLGL
jgi:PHD/YefM family antitoxin component YafN of YafNO toxin-antitoxin module